LHHGQAGSARGSGKQSVASGDKRAAWDWREVHKGEQMGATMTLADFYRFIRQNRKRMGDIYREIEEIQYQFNDLYTRQLEERQNLIASHAPLLLESSQDLPKELSELFRKRENAEREAIEEEIDGLERQISEKRLEADRLIEEAQRQMAYLREQNPILDQQEEELKDRRASLRSRIRELDTEVTRLNRFPIGWLVNFAKRRRMSQERAQLAEHAQAMSDGIRAVREKWQGHKDALKEKQSSLQGKWQNLSVEAAQLQSRCEHLRASIGQRSRTDAAQNLLSNLKEVPSSASSWQDRVAPLVELNRSNAIYETGLTAVAEILGLLKGLQEGMDRFLRSVATVHEEQQRYRLPSLTLELSDAVTSFYAALPGFQTKVKDEKYLGTHPLEFSQRVRDFMQAQLHEAAIKEMFKDMGDALSRATEAWR
jgi:chromosome segregation ATPase